MARNFFFNDTATTEIYTLSLHDALPICFPSGKEANDYINAKLKELNPDGKQSLQLASFVLPKTNDASWREDRKSTRLNSSHQIISYAVFCLKKKKIQC